MSIRISIVGENGQDLDIATVTRLRRTAMAAHMAREKGVDAGDIPDLWTGDGHLIPTRSTDDAVTYTYVPETY